MRRGLQPRRKRPLQDDFRHVSGEGRSGSVRTMETEIRKDNYRRSRVLFLLVLASLVGLFGLGSYLYHHPEVVIPHLVGRLASVTFFGALPAGFRERHGSPSRSIRRTSTATFAAPILFRIRRRCTLIVFSLR